MNAILASMTTSVTELKRNYAGILKQADDCPVAVLNHNRPEAYLLPAAYYENLVAYMEDLEDAKLVRERADGPFVEVTINEL
jgi:antitoxin StbD